MGSTKVVETPEGKKVVTLTFHSPDEDDWRQKLRQQDSDKGKQKNERSETDE